MDDRRARMSLAALAIAMIAFAIVYAVARPASERPAMPEDPIAIARRLASHPDDWEAASALTEHALDAPVADRLALWRAARDTAARLAPNRDAPRVALARSVFFHWTEMSAADHAAALNAIAPLLRDPSMFFRMARPLFDLTGDLGMLRRWQPASRQSIEWLIGLALPNGRFADYRELRRQLVARQYADVTAKLSRLSPADIINALPDPPYTTDQQPLIMAVLNELHSRPLDDDPHRVAVVDALIDYAVRHHLRPLDGLANVTKMAGVASNAERLALANELGLSKEAFTIRMSLAAPIAPPKVGVWQGTHADQWQIRDFHGPSSITIQRTASDEVPPYVEIFLDDARVAEGEVVNTRTFAIPPAEGSHRVDVRLVNLLTRNLVPRAIRIVDR